MQEELELTLAAVFIFGSSENHTNYGFMPVHDAVQTVDEEWGGSGEVLWVWTGDSEDSRGRSLSLLFVHDSAALVPSSGPTATTCQFCTCLFVDGISITYCLRTRLEWLCRSVVSDSLFPSDKYKNGWIMDISVRDWIGNKIFGSVLVPQIG